MRCEEVRLRLFDYTDGALAGRERSAVSEHLETCAVCRRDHEDILALERAREVWHDVPAPRWRPPLAPRRLDLSPFQQWFPSLASALALVLVVGLYFRPGETPMPPGASRPAAGSLVAPSALPASTTVETLLANNRQERQQELLALVQLLRADMDRRSEQTEESLRYVIAHQLQGQRDIDDLYRYVRKASAPGGNPQERM